MLWRVKIINKKEGFSDNGIPVGLQICLIWEHTTLQFGICPMIFCSIYYQQPCIRFIFSVLNLCNFGSISKKKRKYFLLSLDPYALTTQESELTKGIRKNPDILFIVPQVPSWILQHQAQPHGNSFAFIVTDQAHASEVNFLAPGKHWPNKRATLHTELHQEPQVKWNRFIMMAHVERFELSSTNWPTHFHQSALPSCAGFQTCVMRSSWCSRKHVSDWAGLSPESFRCIFRRNQPQS